MAEVDNVIAETLDHEERAVVALEQIGEALTTLAKLGSQVFDKFYPVKVPRDATVTHLPSAEDELRESLGETGEETTEEWVGLREQEVIEKKKQ